MVRRLVLGMMLMGCAAVAQGLGLGDIQARSALNQNFDAEIDLLSVASGEIDGVRIQLASAEAFQRAGVERPFYLSSLRFQPKRLADGRAVVHVTTDSPVREPFLNFLLEVNWPNGRLVREYTVLLDPPTTLDRRAAAVRPATVSPAPQYSQPAPSPSRTPAPVAPAQPSVDEYGPIQSDETLWGVARRVRPTGVTMEQMMIALQKANPQAFMRGNINLLKKGQILRVPGRDEILSINRREARESYRTQQDAWLASQSTAMQQARSDSAAADAATDDGGQLRIATPRPEGKGDAGAAEDDASKTTVDSIEGDLLLAHENAETARQESELLRSQVNELEMHLKNMERLLTLKDDQLARLQSSIAAEPTGVELAPVAEEMADTPTPAVTEEATDVAEAAVTEPAEAEATEEAAQIAAEPAVAPADDQPSQAATPAPVYEPEMAETEKSQDRGLMGLLEDPLILGAGGVGLLVILGLLFALSRKGRQDEEEEVEEDEGMGESILLEPEPEELSDEAGEETDTAAGSSDTSFLSEFSPSDVQALQDETSEVDPLSEADVYIAYGRYQQAEELLSQALDKEPDRLPLKHKLLEVFFAKPDVTAFVALANELVVAGLHTADDESWERICEMGRELAPEEEMFRAGGDELVTDSVISEVDEDLGLSELADLAEDESTFIQDLESEIGTLDTLGLSDSSGSGLDSQASSSLESLDIELPELELPSQSNEPEEDEEDILHLDLNLDSDSMVNEESVSAGLMPDEEDVLALDDLDDFSELTEELSQLEEASALLDEPIALELPEGEDELDLELDNVGSDLDSLASDLADGDEVDTKLDLARAYIEMGDSEGARGLLTEVQEEGNGEQQATASELLGNLSDN